MLLNLHTCYKAIKIISINKEEQMQQSYYRFPFYDSKNSNMANRLKLLIC